MLFVTPLLLVTAIGVAAADLYGTEASVRPEPAVSAASPAILSASPAPSPYPPEEYAEAGIALARSADAHDPVETTDSGDASHHGGGYKIVQWEWSYVQTPYIIAIWILVASVAKIRE